MHENYPMINKAKTGQRIRLLMNQRNLTVHDVQKYLGFATPQAVYHWLNGRSLPTIDNVYALSELFQVTLDEIICGNRLYQPENIGQRHRLQRYMEYILRIPVA